MEAQNASCNYTVNPEGISKVWYKNWTAVKTDFSDYIGQQVTLKFCTADCGKGGHYAYAYIDVSCGDGSACKQVPTPIAENSNAYGISVFPNPVTDLLTIQMPSTFHLASIEVIDISGISLLKKTVESTTQLDLPFKNFNAGVYFLKVVGKDNIETFFKIIK